MRTMFFLLVLSLISFACEPDNDWVKTDEVEVGYALMHSFYNPFPDTLFCIRTVQGKDTVFYETGCVDNRITPAQGDSKDTIYRTEPWPFIRFVVYPKAVKRFEKCGASTQPGWYLTILKLLEQ